MSKVTLSVRRLVVKYSGRDWRVACLLAASLIGGLHPRRSEAGISGMTRVASAFNASTNPTGIFQPIEITHAPGDRSRLFIVQRNGRIRILDLTSGSMIASDFLSISGVLANGEGGLLGMAFHPDYANNGKFYTYSTHDDANGASAFSTEIREWSVSANPNVANATFNTLLTIPRPQSNHVGGWIGFQPGSAEANLYIASGDGGGGNDTGTGHTSGTGNAQDGTANLLGKMLRINVDSDAFPGDATKNYAIPSSNPFTAGKPDEAFDDEIWAYGLRNPFRNSFDRATGDLWIGDVGQDTREEIDFQAADSSGGANYGWRLREGSIQTPASGIGGPIPPRYVPPVYDYDRDNDPMGGTVVSGGYVYRGPDPTLQGKYFFLDSRNSATTTDDNYWYFDPANPYGTVTNIDAALSPSGTATFPVAYGEDAIGNLYVAYIGSSEVFRINTNAFTPGDFDGDADVDDDDLAAWTAGFGAATGATRQQGDADGDGDVDGGDFLAWQQNLGWSSLNVGSPSNGVPEPAAATIALAAIGLLAARRRR